MTKYVDAGDIDLDAEEISFQGERKPSVLVRAAIEEYLASHEGR